MKKALLILTVLVVGVMPFSVANATNQVVFGHSGRSIAGHSAVGHYVRMGSGYEGSVRYLYFHVYDDGSASYFSRFQVYVCDDDVPENLNNCKFYTAYADATNYYTVSQTSGGWRTIQVDLNKRMYYNGSTYTYTGSGGALALDSSKYYWLYFASTNGPTTGPTQAGTVGIAGIYATLNSNGTPIQHRYWNGGAGGALDSAIGSPYFLGSTDVVTEWPGFEAPSSGSSPFDISGADTWCARYSNTFANGLCNIGGFLFIPSKESIEGLITELEVIKTKPPFSFFVGFSNAWTEATSSSQDFVEVNIPIEMFGASGSVTAVSSASFDRWVSPATWTLVRGLTTVALYLIFGFYAWNRGRKIFNQI